RALDIEPIGDLGLGQSGGEVKPRRPRRERRLTINRRQPVEGYCHAGKPTCNFLRVLQKIAKAGRDVNPPNVLQCNRATIAFSAATVSTVTRWTWHRGGRMAGLFLGIDVGSGGVRACAVDTRGDLLGMESATLPPPRREGDAVDQDPEFWW